MPTVFIYGICTILLVLFAVIVMPLGDSVRSDAITSLNYSASPGFAALIFWLQLYWLPHRISFDEYSAPQH
jgi:hypothetical protein